jgi:hypothetical protein
MYCHKVIASIFVVMLVVAASACDDKDVRQENGTVIDSTSSTLSEDGVASETVLDTTPRDVEVWQITAVRCEISDDLSTTQSAVQYDGDSITIELNEKPKEGNVFVLIEMIIEKTGVGAGAFEWDHSYVLDSSDNQYQRHANDTFLQNFNLPRIKSTDLVFGKNEGFVCYELPREAADDALFFVYQTDADMVTIRIR